MDTCKICGRKNPMEDANFCYYCGASLKDGESGDAINGAMMLDAIRNSAGFLRGEVQQVHADTEDVTEWNQGTPGYRNDTMSVQHSEGMVPILHRDNITDEEQEMLYGKPFSKWKWFGTFLLLLIPVYGWIAFFVIMLISAFGGSATKERKEMAKGMLLFMIIFVILMAVYMVQLFNNPEFMEQYNRMMEELMAGNQ